MATWYRTRSYSTDIDEVEVESFTDHFIRRAELKRREARLSEFYCYFPTRGEALNHLEKLWTERRGRAESKLHEARSRLGEIKAMRKKLPEGRG